MTTKNERAAELQIDLGNTLDRFNCEYEKKWTDEVGDLQVCKTHGEWSVFDIDYGNHRPCNAATLEDKQPLTLVQFLYDRAHQARQGDKLTRAIHMILEEHEQFPVLVEKKPELTTFSMPDNINGYVMKLSQDIAWMTTQEYRVRFGDEAPTNPLLAKIASLYSDHRDYREDWSR